MIAVSEFVWVPWKVRSEWVYGHGAAARKRVKASGGSMPFSLDGREQAPLVKARLATNDLVAALKGGGDWHPALSEYAKVAVTTIMLDPNLHPMNPEPDWKNILAQFANAPEQCTDRLPVLAAVASHAVRAVLGVQGRTEPACGRPSSQRE
jgi:hypothetical protein